jgi:hypothetical protein
LVTEGYGFEPTTIARQAGESLVSLASSLLRLLEKIMLRAFFSTLRYAKSNP